MKRKTLWIAFAIVTLWIAGCAFWQLGLKAFRPCAFLAVAWLVALASPYVFRLWRRLPAATRTLITGLALIGGFVWLLESTDQLATDRRVRDGVCVCIGVVLAALLGHRRVRLPDTAPPSKWFGRFELAPRFFTLCVFFVWIFVSWADRHFEEPLPLNPKRLATDETRAGPRVGLALSGGGYRAALFHAGVLTALEERGLRPCCVSSVSGGSILSTFYSLGGDPREFLRAVKTGRFNLKRELANLSSIGRMACPGFIPGLRVKALPFGEATRLDIQASMLDRLLLRGRRCGDALPGGAPNLMLCATDVNHGWQIGFTRDGLVFDGVSSDRFIEARDGQFPRGELWAQLAAISGAFPGAFPLTNRTVRLGWILNGSLGDVRTGEILKVGNDPGIQLQLADGGVIDNLGLHLLLVAARRAKVPGAAAPLRNFPNRKLTPAEAFDWAGRNVGWGKRDMDASWHIDVALVSNGGMMLAPRIENGEAGLGRVVDIATGLSTTREEEILRDRTILPVGGKLPIHLFSPALLGDPPDLEIGGGPNAEYARIHGRHSAHIVWNLTAILVNNGLLDRVLSLNPDQVHIRDRLRAVEEKMSKLESASEQEKETAGMTYSTDHPILHDIGTCLAAFERTDTLKDQIPPFDADAIYRLGQYSVYLGWNRLQKTLEDLPASEH